MYQLRQVETLLSEKKKPSSTELKNEQHKIEEGVLAYLYAEHSLENKQIYVRQHAKGLISVIEKATANKNAALQKVSEQVFVFLEKHGEPYWDHNLHVPDFIKQPVLELAKVSLPIVSKKIAQLKVDPPFEPVIGRDIEMLIANTDIRYGQLDLLRGVMADLKELPDIVLPESEEFDMDDVDKGTKEMMAAANRQLRDILCRINFNSMAVYAFATAKISKDEQETPDGDSLFRLMRMQQYYDCIKVNANSFYQADRPTLTEMLSNYLEDRLVIMQRELMPANTTAAPIGPDSQKVNTSLTIEKLGFFLRLFVDTYVFRSNNWKGLCRFMATYVITVGRSETKREAASDGLYTNMYSPTMKTVVSVIDILERMLKRAIMWKNALKKTGKPPGKVEN